jgi:hypothetical protein
MGSGLAFMRDQMLNTTPPPITPLPALHNPQTSDEENPPTLHKPRSSLAVRTFGCVIKLLLYVHSNHANNSQKCFHPLHFRPGSPLHKPKDTVDPPYVLLVMPPQSNTYTSRQQTDSAST